MTHLILRDLDNGQDTDLRRGRIRNADAVLLLLDAHGGMASARDLLGDLRGWRPGRKFTYLFQVSETDGRGYGFCGTDLTSASTTVYHHPTTWELGSSEGHASTRRQYYYRVRRGLYGITLEGYKRLAELAEQTRGTRAADHRLRRTYPVQSSSGT